MTDAPECYEYDGFLEQSSLKAKQYIDIWSLGCVFSEAATWIAYGYEGIKQYRIRRKEDIDGPHDFRDGNCFHNGKDVFLVVVRWHEEMAEVLRGSDNITKTVVALVEQDMLVPSEFRLTAQRLWEKTGRILKQATQVTTDSVSIKSTPSELQSQELPSTTNSATRRGISHQPQHSRSNGESSTTYSGNFGLRRENIPDWISSYGDDEIIPGISEYPSSSSWVNNQVPAPPTLDRTSQTLPQPAPNRGIHTHTDPAVQTPVAAVTPARIPGVAKWGPELTIAYALSWRATSEGRREILNFGHGSDTLPHMYLQKRLETRDHVGSLSSTTQRCEY